MPVTVGVMVIRESDICCGLSRTVVSVTVCAVSASIETSRQDRPVPSARVILSTRLGMTPSNSRI